MTGKKDLSMSHTDSLPNILNALVPESKIIQVDETKCGRTISAGLIK